jgi:PhzF family phenazine biosynthesis protein
MDLDLYIINAFTSQAFQGNPAAVCPLKEWLPDELMHKIAAQNNLSETAFFVPVKEGFHIRWFTPAAEVDLCGHATLATAFVMKEFLGYKDERLSFDSRSGSLHVTFQASGIIELDLPANPVSLSQDKEQVASLTCLDIKSLYETGSWYVAELSSEQEVADFVPDFEQIRKLPKSILVITAPGTDCDFVSRCFGPQLGIDEDPVTGSAHCLLVPLWSLKLKKQELFAKQISERGGELYCKLQGSRVKIAGYARTYLKGSIKI